MTAHFGPWAKPSPCAIHLHIHSPFSTLVYARKEKQGGSTASGQWEQKQVTGGREECGAGVFILLVSSLQYRSAMSWPCPSSNGHSSWQVTTLLPLTAPSGPEVVMVACPLVPALGHCTLPSFSFSTVSVCLPFDHEWCIEDLLPVQPGTECFQGSGQRRDGR